ncbi:DUF2510 domain-containing protein [Cumulibacter soli]|uniref:DUF2510 domain-containing protein n=1 Tax=Cumulibacter soli TaxID=2546344 RepID=UPI00141A0631|nr:DUF2510 domain-containing protein [Cumulibacter soli]
MVAAGWYVDPAGRFPYRYWEGEFWTDYVTGPAGQGVDPLTPSPPAAQSAQHPPASAGPMQHQSANSGPMQQPAGPGPDPQGAAPSTPQPGPGPGHPAGGRIQTNPAELQAVLAELGIYPAPSGDGTPFGEPMLILARSAERDDAVEWWTPSGLLVASGTIVEKAKPGTFDAPSTDQASGAMIGTLIEITAADGTSIGTTIRTLKPLKPPTHLDDPRGFRIASVAQDKAFSKIGTFSITGPDGRPLGRMAASDMRARSIALSDPGGAALATIVKYGKWDSGNVIMEYSRNRPFQTLSQWIANRAVDALWPIQRERVMSVLIRDRPGSTPLENLLAFAAPLMMEHISSVF